MLCDQLKDENEIRSYVVNGYHYFLKISPDIAKAYDALFLAIEPHTKSINYDDLKSLYSMCSEMVQKNQFDNFAKVFGHNFLLIVEEISKKALIPFDKSTEYKRLKELVDAIPGEIHPRMIVKWRVS